MLEISGPLQMPMSAAATHCEWLPAPPPSTARYTATAACPSCLPPSLAQAFDMFDKDGSGSIDSGELRQVLEVPPGGCVMHLL